MNKTAVSGAIAFSALTVGATIDAALGLGGVAWLAEICFTDDTDMGAMDMSPREVKPLPLIGLSLGATTAALGLMSWEHRRSQSVFAVPGPAEQATILSAMLMVAHSLGKTSRDEIAGFFRIATQNELDPAVTDLVVERFQAMQGSAAVRLNLAPPRTALGRRRVLAAAMLMLRKPGAITPAIEALVEDIIHRIGGTMEDAVDVRDALNAWDADCRNLVGVPLYSVLRDRPLNLRPA